MIGGRGDSLRPKSTSPITTSTFSIIVKKIVVDLLRPTFTSCIIPHTIIYFIFINTIIQMVRRTRYTQQSTITIWVVLVRVAGLGPIPTSTIATNSFSLIDRGKLAGILRPRYTSTIINSYISPRFDIITTSIPPPIFIIKTGITLLFFMKIFIYMTRRN